tara:strand:- start:61 stop:459 length:399 start_codon:yes stop_codon:yes gene_type:complete
MALNYDVTQVKNAWFKVDQKTLDEEARDKRNSIFGPTRYKEDGVTYEMEQPLQTVIFLTMTLGMNEVTEKNKEKFFNRIKFMESRTGVVMRLNDEPHPFTMDMVEECIGLTTNASTMTRAQFIKNQTQYLDL